MVEMHPIRWVLAGGAGLCVAGAAFPYALSALGMLGAMSAFSMALLNWSEPRIHTYNQKLFELASRLPN